MFPAPSLGRILAWQSINHRPPSDPAAPKAGAAMVHGWHSWLGAPRCPGCSAAGGSPACTCRASATVTAWPARSPGNELCQELSLARRSHCPSRGKGVQGLCQVRAEPDPSPRPSWAGTAGAGGPCPATPALLVLSLPCPSQLFSLLQDEPGKGEDQGLLGGLTLEPVQKKNSKCFRL